jgi:hypothetical protein
MKAGFGKEYFPDGFSSAYLRTGIFGLRQGIAALSGGDSIAGRGLHFHDRARSSTMTRRAGKRRFLAAVREAPPRKDLPRLKDQLLRAPRRQVERAESRWIFRPRSVSNRSMRAAEIGGSKSAPCLMAKSRSFISSANSAAQLSERWWNSQVSGLRGGTVGDEVKVEADEWFRG